MKFDAVVFAGGGCRCFWQAGFWATAQPHLGFEPRAIAAVSAGAAFACAAVGGAIDAVVRDFVRRTARNPRNFYPANLFRSTPAFPHARMYRSAILETMDHKVLERVHAGPDIRVMMTRPPRRIAATPALLVGFAAYKLNRAVSRRVHATWPRRLGFRPKVVSAQSCATPEELADLILQSSCMPPLTPLYRRGGEVVLDGGVVDSAPVDVVDDCASALVLLTRRHATVPVSPRRLYVQPSEPIPVVMWDYASPALIQETFDLGRRDGEAFAAAHRRANTREVSANGPS